MKLGFKKVWQNYKVLIKDALKDLKTKGRRHRQIPNILTSTRLVAAPCFIIPAAISANVPLIILFTVLFSLTDAVDGFIARKYHLTSELGKDLDAICDKVFAGTLLIAASLFNPTLLFNLVFEGIIAGINIKQKLENKAPRSLYVGKIKTCVLYPLLGAGFLTKFIDIPNLFNTLFIATTSMQMLTITSYLLKYDHEIKEDKLLASTENDNKDIEFTDEEDEKGKQKEISAKNISHHQKELNNTLDEYKELRDLLTHEVSIHEEETIDNGVQKNLK